MDDRRLAEIREDAMRLVHLVCLCFARGDEGVPLDIGMGGVHPVDLLCKLPPGCAASVALGIGGGDVRILDYAVCSGYVELQGTDELDADSDETIAQAACHHMGSRRARAQSVGDESGFDKEFGLDDEAMRL